MLSHSKSTYIGPISNATITVINSTSVTLHWKGPVAAQSVVTGYRIMINGEEVVLLGSELMATIIHLSIIIHTLLNLSLFSTRSTILLRDHYQ